MASSERRRYAGLTLALLVIAFALRVWALGAQSLWFDEGWSWHLARLPLAEMAAVTAGDRSPALYYGLLHGWMTLAGDSEFALRAPSALADTLTTAAVMALSAQLARSRRAGLFAGGLYAVCGFALWYAGEARMYALVAMFATLSSLALLRALSRPTGAGRCYAASAVLLAAAIHCHYYAVFLLPAHVAVVAGVAWRARAAQGWPGAWRIARAWFRPTALATLTVLAWLLFARGGFAYDDGFVFPLNTVAGRLLEFAEMLGGVRVGQERLARSDVWGVLLGVALGAACAALALLKRWRPLLMALALIALPLLAATVAVRLVYPERSVFHPRYLIYVVPMVAVLVGQAGAMRTRVARGLGLLGVIALAALWLPGVLTVKTDPRAARDDTRAAVAHVAEALAADDAVVMVRDNFAARYYWARLGAPAGRLLAAPEGLHGVLTDEGPVLGQIAALDARRVRLFLWQDDVVDAEKRVETALQANGHQLGEFNFGQIRLPLYALERRPPVSMAGLMTARPPARFGAGLDLVGQWMEATLRPGDVFHVVLAWRAAFPLAADDKVFVHVVGADGQIAFQRDKQPLSALQPMTRWSPGRTVHDPYTLLAPPTLAPGEYRVVVGVYDPQTGQRRALAGGGDSLVVGVVLVR